MKLRDVFEDDEEPEHSTQIGLPNPLKVAGGSPPVGTLRLVVVNESLLNTHALPDTGTVVIGRAPDAEVFVPHASVSRRHAVLRIGPVITLEDLGSANGTAVNNVRLAPSRPVVVSPSDAIRVGKVLVIIQREGGEPPSEGAEGTAKGGSPAYERSEKTSADLEIDGRPVVVRSEVMQQVFALAGRVAKTNMGVLILGETGTGKEIIAQAIHRRSERRKKPFVVLNCAALSDSLLESELFGHEKGAYTGAHEAKIGLFEKATGGTVFLDEIGDMSLASQAKLLRVLEERRILRLGAVEPRPIDVRFVSATNKDLAREVDAGRFRKDFLFRLSGVTVRVPPLREREAEIEPLARSFIASFAAENGRKSTPELTATALDLLRGHPWPGNIRELKSVMELAVVRCGDGAIEPAHLEFGGWNQAADTPSVAAPVRAPAPGERVGLGDELESLERDRIIEALERAGGNQTRAAELLGIPRRTLVRKLDLHALPRPRKARDGS